MQSTTQNTRTFRNTDKMSFQAKKQLEASNKRGKSWKREERPLWEGVE